MNATDTVIRNSAAFEALADLIADRVADQVVERLAAIEVARQEAARMPEPLAEYGELITRSEVADILRVSTRQVTNLVNSGKLPRPSRLGKEAAFPKAVVAKILKNKTKI